MIAQPRDECDACHRRGETTPIDDGQRWLCSACLVSWDMLGML